MHTKLLAATLIPVVLVVAMASARSDRAQPTAPPSSGAPATNVEEITLANGFRMLVVADARVPRVAASLWYRFGSLAESNGRHGAAHFLEHAVHQGTTTVGTTDFTAERPILREIYETEQQLLAARNAERNRLRERAIFFDELDWPTTPEIDRLRRRLYELEDKDSQYREFWSEFTWYQGYGYIGRHTDPVPATTSTEHLEIDIDLPKENIELFFRLEADRMTNAVLRGWEAQRFTVLEQILNRYHRPETGRFYEALNGVTGLSHPIYLSPGGHLRDFSYFSRADMMRMYDEFFVPNNATLALVGDLTAGQAKALAERYFGQIPRGAESPALMDLEAEPPPGGAARLDWLEPLDSRVIVRYRIPGVGHPDRPVFDVIAALLRGRRGMLATKLARTDVEAPIADFATSASRNGSPNNLNIVARAQRDEALPVLEKGILEVVNDLRAGRIDPAALDRARKSLGLEWDQVRSDRGSLASALGSFQITDSWKTLQPFMAARKLASAEDIRRAAQKYLIPINLVIATSRQHPASENPVASPERIQTAERHP